MTIRQDAIRLYSNRLIGHFLPYKVKPNHDLNYFVNSQEVPEMTPGMDDKQIKRAHKTAWTKFFMAFARQYPGEE